jgi:hypothetical protein
MATTFAVCTVRALELHRVQIVDTWMLVPLLFLEIEIPYLRAAPKRLNRRETFAASSVGRQRQRREIRFDDKVGQAIDVPQPWRFVCYQIVCHWQVYKLTTTNHLSLRINFFFNQPHP